MTEIAPILLALHGLLCVLAGAAGPAMFLRYQVVVSAVYASGLPGAVGGLRLTPGGAEVGLTGGLWLMSVLVMLPLMAFYWRTGGGRLSPLTRHYALVVAGVIVFHGILGRWSAAALLNGLELLYPLGVLLLWDLSGRTAAVREELTEALLVYGAVMMLLIPLNLLLLGPGEGGVLVNARVMSTAMLPTLCLLLALGLRADVRWLLGAAFLLLVPLATVSRGVTLAIGGSLALFLVTRGFGGTSPRPAAVIVLAVIAAGAVVFAGGEFVERTFGEEYLNPAEGVGVNTSGRVGLWMLFAGTLEGAPLTRLLFGDGLGAADAFTLAEDPSSWFRHPHSEVLRFLVNVGIVGLAAYYSMLLHLPWKRGARGRADRSAAIVGAAAQLLAPAMLILSVYENFIFYNPYGFTQNAFLLFALASWNPEGEIVSSRTWIT